MMENKDFPKRTPNRLGGFDYSTGYSYFITICTQSRVKTLSKIVGEWSPLPHLTKQGEIIKNLIENIPSKYSNFSVDYYVIMPNHIHLLISVYDIGRGDPLPYGVLVYRLVKISSNKRNQHYDEYNGAKTISTLIPRPHNKKPK